MADSSVSRFGCYTIIWDTTRERRRVIVKDPPGVVTMTSTLPALLGGAAPNYWPVSSIRQPGRCAALLSQDACRAEGERSHGMPAQGRSGTSDVEGATDRADRPRGVAVSDRQSSAKPDAPGLLPDRGRPACRDANGKVETHDRERGQHRNRQTQTGDPFEKAADVAARQCPETDNGECFHGPNGRDK